MILFEGLEKQATELAQRVGHHASIAIANEQGGSVLLHETARVLGEDAVVVHVPRDLDRMTYLMLSAAAQCGAGALEQMASRLAAHQDDPSQALSAFDAVLGRRQLLVDDIDALRGAEDTELREVFAPSFKQVHAWLKARASVVTSLSGEELAHPCVEGPRPDERWDAQSIWARVGQDVDLYTLAVARTLLLGTRADEADLGWDADSIVGDLWRGMPLEMRDLVTLLAVHGRPVDGILFERLGLVSLPVVETGLKAHIVERSRAGLGLAAPAAWGKLLSPSAQREAHRRLADQFARIARDTKPSDAAPLAILEAHRHYTAIPDVACAREFADFGVMMLLASGKSISLEGRYNPPSYNKAARVYDVVLQLDEQVRTSGKHDGIGRLARAYALHYRAYNRYKAQTESPLETLAAYRDALRLWPQNALFWSRTIRCCFVAGLYEEGVRARDDAFEEVPAHPQRAALIIGRTVERLLKRGMVLAAILVWRDHRPETLTEKDVERQFLERLAQGWQEKKLWVRGTSPLVFRVPVQVRVTAQERAFICEVLARRGQGPSPEAALREVVRELFAELRGLVEDEERSADRESRRRELIEVTDLEALRSDGEMAVRWLAHLASMDGLVARGLVTKAQQQSLLRTWGRVRRVFPTLRQPAVGRTEDGLLYLSWSFMDRPAVTFTVDIQADGRVDWFYRDTAEGQAHGTEDALQAELPDETIHLLAPFAS